MANAYYAADYGNPPPQMQQFTPVVRPFNVMVNSTAGASYGIQGYPVVSTLGVGDTISLCTLPGSGSGIILLDYYIDFGVLDTGAGSATLVMELGLALDSLDPGPAPNGSAITSAAAAGFFATLITPPAATNSGCRLNPQALFSDAATPVSEPVTFPNGVLPFSISNLAPSPNSGLYDFQLKVTTAADVVSATAAYIRGWIAYAQISQPWAN